MNITKRKMSILVSLIILNMSNGTIAAQARGSNQDCDQLHVFIQSVSFANALPDNLYDLKSAYAGLALYLISRVKVGRSFCGFSDANVVYLLRQAVIDFKYGNSNQLGENINAGTHADVSVGMTQLFKQGKFGFPKDKELSNCWSHSELYGTCEALEQFKYCYINNGKQPAGFKSLRSKLVSTKKCP
jgi:hypothetical protein